ncbi:hypothetical protein P3T23_000284 [Paraburkholderia sp. GAS448]|uniref:hypothetical protein n=1 Tax=Paraburkholderia sp. GAS448 TaxID=3035136 RepID=UPI003D209B19
MKQSVMVGDMGKALLYKSAKCLMVAVAISGFQSIYADEDINDSNCMQHLGGGGFGDFDCYEHHAKSLEADNKKVSNAITLARGVTSANKAELNQYMRAQDDAAKACDLAIKLEYPSQKERMRRDHIELYDVMAARCHYSIRKQQNEFLLDLYSITNG